RDSYFREIASCPRDRFSKRSRPFRQSRAFVCARDRAADAISNRDTSLSRLAAVLRANAQARAHSRNGAPFAARVSLDFAERESCRTRRRSRRRNFVETTFGRRVPYFPRPPQRR